MGIPLLLRARGDLEAQREGFDAIADLIQAADTVAICAHTTPDGDALGSTLALARAIRSIWPGTEVTCLLADDQPIPVTLRFLPGAEELVRASEYEGEPDLFVCVDLSSANRLNNAEAVMRRARRVAVIDHHPAGEPYWDAAAIRPEACAAGVLVAEFIEHCGGGMTSDMAQNLLCAIMTDTGRFQYQNADPEAFSVASFLVNAGANPSEISLNVYQSDRLAYLHLEAKVMSRVVTFNDGRISYSYATLDDINGGGVSMSECDGLIDVVRRVAGAEVSLFLKEVAAGKVRGNLRAKTHVDISGIARELGGGGHAAAAGFTMDGGIDEVLSAVLPRLHALLDGGEEGRRGA